MINWAIIGTILNKTWNVCKHKYDQLTTAVVEQQSAELDTIQLKDKHTMVVPQVNNFHSSVCLCYCVSHDAFFCVLEDIITNKI